MTNSCVDDYRLNGNALKIIASLSMLIDHVGVILLPSVSILRVIGRIAFPVYAFMIAEGCAYTKNKLRYFLSVFLLGAACQIVYFIYDREIYLGILITFSLSILVAYSMQYLKDAMFAAESSHMKRCAASVGFVSAVAGVYFLNEIFRIDYGFWGCMAPAFASLFRKPRAATFARWEKVDNPMMHVTMLGVCLIFLSCVSEGFQMYSLLAIPLLLFYSGKRGNANMKYFFYIFYPTHLLALEAISFLFK